jgi:hypothetical protein
MMPDLPPRTGICRSETGAEKAGKADGRVWADKAFGETYAQTACLQAFSSGETRTRTGDTTIFSRVLYQLSYLAVMG